MAFFETDDADIPADMRGYLKTQNEQKKFGITERFEKLFQSLYFDTAGTGAWLPGAWLPRSTSPPPIASCSAAIIRWSAKARQILSSLWK